MRLVCGWRRGERGRRREVVCNGERQLREEGERWAILLMEIFGEVDGSTRWRRGRVGVRVAIVVRRIGGAIALAMLKINSMESFVTDVGTE